MNRSPHKDLIEDYFEIINTKDKSYWLGFLFADGDITIIKNKNQKSMKRVRIEISERDSFIIQKFVDDLRLNKDMIRHRVKKK